MPESFKVVEYRFDEKGYHETVYKAGLSAIKAGKLADKLNAAQDLESGIILSYKAEKLVLQ